MDSAVGLDGLPYSLLKLYFPWWQDALLAFFNLVFSWSVVPTVWKRSIIVPVFKRGDPTLPNNYRPISLASCFFKVLEHLVHSRIAPISFPNWMSPKDSVGVPMSSSVPWFPCCPLVLPLTHLSLSSTFRKHLTHHGSRGLWCGFLMLVSGAACGFLHGTQSQVRCGSSLSEPWVDSGIAQGRVLSPLLFNLLINSLIASVRQVAPGVQFCSSSLRVPSQLYADDLELSAECANCDGVSSSGGDSDSHSHGLPTPVTWSLGEIDSSPNVLHGAKLKGSPCALLPPCSPPACCPASPGGLRSSSLLLLPSG